MVYGVVYVFVVEWSIEDFAQVPLVLIVFNDDEMVVEDAVRVEVWIKQDAAVQE